MKKGKIIAYCDGGANPNPGLAGFGVHASVVYYEGKSVAVSGKYAVTSLGYQLKTEIGSDIAKRHVIKETRLIPTDNNEMIPMVMGEVFDFYGCTEWSNTNNQAELDGAITALEKIPIIVESLPDTEIKDVLLLLDSTYTLLFLKKMIVNKFNLKEVDKNKGHVARLEKAYLAIKDDYKISVGKVLAHDTNLGNNQADMLATMGVFKRTSQNGNHTDVTEIIHTKDKYWNDSKFDTDLLYTKQLFSFTPVKNSTPGLYFGINYKDLTDMGKKISNVTYSILKLPEPDTMVTKIASMIKEKLNTGYFPYVLNLNIITNKKVLRDFLRYGSDFVRASKKRDYNIKTATGLVIAQVLEQPALSTVVMHRFSELHRFTDSIVEGKDLYNTKTIDITDYIYEVNSKNKNIIKPEFVNDKYVIKVPYKHSEDFRAITIRVRPNLDLPSRNKLKRLESKKPNVKLVLTWENDIMEYSLLLKLEDGTIIYSSNVYANKLILKHTKNKK